MVEELRQLWAAGVSAAVIAKELGRGFSRNAVLGKAMRLNLGPHKMARIGRPKGSRTKRPRKPRPQIIRIVKAASLPDEAPKPPRMRRLPLLALADHHCRFPFGDPQRGAFFFCAADIAEGQIYCSWHQAAAYVKRPRQ